MEVPNLNRAVWLMVLALLTICALPVQSSSQITFEKTYGGPDDDMGYCVRQTTDGGYVILGTTERWGPGWQEIYLVKTDSLGHVGWTRTYGLTGWDVGYSVQQTSDGGYVIVGQEGPVGPDFTDIYLLKTDSLGAVDWAKTYDYEYGRDLGASVQETSDGNYIIAGAVEAGYHDMYVAKIDFKGAPIWTRAYGGSSYDGGQSVQQTEDGGYIIAGYTSSFGAGMADMYLIKTDPSGDSTWTRTYGGIVGDYGESVRQTSDSGFIIAGYTWSFGAGDTDVYVIKTDFLGGVVWTKTYGSASRDKGHEIQETTDGGYAIVGITVPPGSITYDAWLIKTDSSGDTVWTGMYGGAQQDIGRSVWQTSDGGYIITGSTISYGEGCFDVFLIKTDENGLVARDVALASIDSPPDTVFADSSYRVKATVMNLGNGFANVYAVATIDGYIDTVGAAGIDPDTSRDVYFEFWHVPPTDSTTYRIKVCVYAPGDLDSLNDCMEKDIYAYVPVGVTEEIGTHDIRIAGLTSVQPNPFSGTALISYSIPQRSHVVVEILDPAGRSVQSLVDTRQGPGAYQVVWKPEDRPSGVYLCRFKAGSHADVKKMVLVR